MFNVVQPQTILWLDWHRIREWCAYLWFPIPTTIEFFLFGGLGLTLWVRPKIGDFPPKLGNAWEYVAKENGRTLGNLGLPSSNFNIMETGPSKHSVILPYFTSQFPWWLSEKLSVHPVGVPYFSVPSLCEDQEHVEEIPMEVLGRTVGDGTIVLGQKSWKEYGVMKRVLQLYG